MLTVLFFSIVIILAIVGAIGCNPLLAIIVPVVGLIVFLFPGLAIVAAIIWLLSKIC